MPSPNEKILMHISNFRPVKRVGAMYWNLFRKGIKRMLPSKLLLVEEEA